MYVLVARDDDDNESMSMGEIAQWIVAGIAMIGISYGAYFVWNRRRNKRRDAATADYNAERVKKLEEDQAAGTQTNGVIRK